MPEGYLSRVCTTEMREDLPGNRKRRVPPRRVDKNYGFVLDHGFGRDDKSEVGGLVGRFVVRRGAQQVPPLRCAPVGMTNLSSGSPIGEELLGSVRAHRRSLHSLCPDLTVEVGGCGELHAAFLDESRTRCASARDAWQALRLRFGRDDKGKRFSSPSVGRRPMTLRSG